MPQPERSRCDRGFLFLVANVVLLVATAPVAWVDGQSIAQFLFLEILTYNAQMSIGYEFAGGNGRVLADDTPDLLLTLLVNPPVSD